MSKFTHNGYEFDAEKHYLHGSTVVSVGCGEDWDGLSLTARGLSSEFAFIIPDKDLHTLREVTIGDPVEKVFVPRKGQAVLVSDNNSQWFVCLFQEMRGDHYRTVVTVDDLKYPKASYPWKFCKPLPEEMK